MDWPHAPVHRFGDAGIYFVTAGTLNRIHIFRDRSALDGLLESLFTQTRKHECQLQAWALFSNHYHLVVEAEAGERVPAMLSAFHVDSAIQINQRDRAKGRQVWYQYRDTQLTHERSWLARLKYTHENAVHHGLVSVAEHYRWCSASWFAANARQSFAETLRRLKIDRVSVYDDYIAAAPDD